MIVDLRTVGCRQTTSRKLNDGPMIRSTVSSSIDPEGIPSMYAFVSFLSTRTDETERRFFSLPPERRNEVTSTSSGTSSSHVGSLSRDAERTSDTNSMQRQCCPQNVPISGLGLSPNEKKAYIEMTKTLVISEVPEVGLEPTRPNGHWILKRRLACFFCRTLALVTDGKLLESFSLGRVDMSQTLGLNFTCICHFGGGAGPSCSWTESV